MLLSFPFFHKLTNSQHVFVCICACKASRMLQNREAKSIVVSMHDHSVCISSSKAVIIVSNASKCANGPTEKVRVREMIRREFRPTTHGMKAMHLPISSPSFESDFLCLFRAFDPRLKARIAREFTEHYAYVKYATTLSPFTSPNSIFRFWEVFFFFFSLSCSCSM